MSVKAWLKDDEDELIEKYTKETKDVYELAEYFGKGHRSVISKLVQLKIYEKPEDKKAPKDRTVKMLLNDLEKILNIQIDGTNLNKKSNLSKLVEAVEQLAKERK